MTIERDGIVEMTNVIFPTQLSQTSFLEGAAGGLVWEAGASAYISGGYLVQHGSEFQRRCWRRNRIMEN